MALAPRTTIGRHQRPPKQKREGDSEPHLALIRRLPCCVCGRAPPSDPHHLMRQRHRRLDRWALPLCFKHHTGSNDSLHMHGNEEAWLTSKGIDGRALCNALWAHRGDFDAMLRVVLRAIQRARTYTMERART